MTDVEKKLAGPLSDELPSDDDWERSTMSATEELRLEVRTVQGNTAAVVDEIENRGGTVETSYGRTIHASIRADKVRDLAKVSNVRLITPEIEPQEFKQTVSEGVTITDADQVHTEGIDGDGAKIAVIDQYFDPSNSKYGGQVVDTIGDSAGFISGTDELHGTGCTEIVYDMAPNADIVLASLVNSNLGAILDKIETSHPDTDVTTMSVGYAPTDRLDGTDDRSNRIANHTTDGRLFTVAAGNEAAGDNWDGPYRDTAGNSIMEFDDSGTEYLQVNDPAPDSLIIANWDDWDELNNLDYTLRVYEDSSKTTLVGEDGPSTEPWGFVQFSSSPPAEAYIEIEKGSNADGTQEFDIWIWGEDANMTLNTYTASQSISIPATSQDTNTLSVAAVQATDKGVEPAGEDLKYYSSRGPTRDDRQGIDIAAPSRVSQTDNGYGSLDDWDPGNGIVTGFNGTSAAAPHVGGAATALFEVDDVTNEDIRAALLETGQTVSDSNLGTINTSTTLIGEGYVNVELAHDELTALEPPLDTKWTSNPLGGRTQYATPEVDSQQVYVGGLQNTFYALSRSDGESVGWTVDRGNKAGLSDSAGYRYSDQIFFGSGQGKLFAVDADDATEHWSGQDVPDLDSAITCRPVVANDNVYAGTNDGRVVSWDYSATRRWSRDVGGGIYSALRTDGTYVYVTTEDGDLVVLATSDGSEQWRGSFSSFGNASPALGGGGRVYVAADEVHAFDAAANKNQLWNSSGFGGNDGSSPIYRDGSVYVGSTDGNLYAIDASSGAVDWTHPTNGAVAAKPGANADGTRIAATSTDGTVYILDSSGNELGTVTDIPSDSRATPVIDGGELFVGGRDGVVRAYE